MAKYLIEEETLRNLAEATRAVSETEGDMTPAQMAARLSETAEVLPTVLRNTEQNLTEAQRLQARTNIGAVDYRKVVQCITPEMYGAVGDGETDDSAAIQAAINKAAANYPVYLGKKSYKISTGLIISTNYSNFRCDGTIIYDGSEAAITLTNIIRSTIYVSAIYAGNGTAVRLTNENGYVKFNDIKVDNIRSSKVGILLTTPSANKQPIYYNKISFMEIVASEIGISVLAEGYHINENRYYGGTIGGGCTYGIKLKSIGDPIEAGAHKFLSGGIEGISDEGYGIYIENSSQNIFENIRTLERYGKYILGLKGISKHNNIEILKFSISEIDISELGEIGTDDNIIRGMSSSIDDGTYVGEKIYINKKYGFVYDTKKSTNSLNHIKISIDNFPDFSIKPINNRIYSSFQSTVHSLNGATFTLDEVYYGTHSLIKGEPVTIWFGDGSGRIKLVDAVGNVIFDNTDGKFDNKTISVKWCGYDAHNGKHIWLINVDGETNLNGKDGYTPVKGTDYFTASDIAEIVNAVYEKVADGNEVAY